MFRILQITVQKLMTVNPVKFSPENLFLATNQNTYSYEEKAHYLFIRFAAGNRGKGAGRGSHEEALPAYLRQCHQIQ